MAQSAKQYTITEPYLDLSCGLGEAPFWEKDRNTLRFLDIVNKKLHLINLSEGPSSHRQVDLEFNLGTTADIENNEHEFIFGGKYGYGIMNRDTGKSRWLAKMWSDEERKPDNGGKPGKGESREHRMRSNDGVVDVRGRYFVGAMNDPAVVGDAITDEGILFRLDPDLSLHRVKHGVSIPNGASFSLDNKTMYFTDSVSGCIMQYPYNIETGEVSWDKGHVFFGPVQGGAPDGHAQDEEGHFWVALFGLGKVVRVNPQGQIVAEVLVPTRCVTCPAFCGSELFITTAAEQDPDNHQWSLKYQGALFKVDVGVRGSPLNKFKLPHGK